MKRISNPWFSFAGVRNTDLGVLMVNPPIRQHPAIQGSQVEIPGKQGKVFFSKNSYGVITVKQDIVVENPDNIPKVMKWLSGKGDLIFWDSPNYAYSAMILTTMARSAVSRRLAGQKMSVTWTCQPFRHAVVQPNIAITRTGYSFLGQGDFDAQPLVKIEGSGEAQIAINGRVMTVMLDSGSPLYIDCDAGIAYEIDSDGVMSFAGTKVIIEDDWFELKCQPLQGTANNIVEFDSNISKVTIMPYWRYF